MYTQLKIDWNKRQYLKRWIERYSREDIIGFCLVIIQERGKCNAITIYEPDRFISELVSNISIETLINWTDYRRLHIKTVLPKQLYIEIKFYFKITEG